MSLHIMPWHSRTFGPLLVMHLVDELLHLVKDETSIGEVLAETLSANAE